MVVLSAFSVSVSVVYSVAAIIIVSHYFWRSTRLLVYLHDMAGYIVLAYTVIIVLATILTKRKKLLELLAITPGLYLALILPPEIAWSIMP